jgi:hypothetical protein
MFAELNDVPLGVKTIAHCESLKRPLLVSWIHHASKRFHRRSNVRKARNEKNELDGCHCSARWRHIDVDLRRDVSWDLKDDQLKHWGLKYDVIFVASLHLQPENRRIERDDTRNVLRIKHCARS